jgi:hypothetical protein
MVLCLEPLVVVLGVGVVIGVGGLSVKLLGYVYNNNEQ